MTGQRTDQAGIRVIALNGGSSRMAADQAEPVHRGVACNLEADTTRTEPPGRARVLAALLSRPLHR